MRRRSALVLLAVIAAGMVTMAQMGPLGWDGISLPRSPEKLLEVLEQETEWLSGLKVEAPGWDKALASLSDSIQAVKEAPEPSLEQIAKLDASLHLVLDILEKQAIRGAVARLKGRDGKTGPEWLEDYLADVTSGMGAEEAARTRAIVEGFVRGFHNLARGTARDRLGEARTQLGQGPDGTPKRGMPQDKGRQLAPQFKLWAKAYLDGATAGLSEEDASEVRALCWGAVKAGQEFRQELRETREENAHHFLKLRLIAARLDILIAAPSGNGD
jgi:hypothetical protein